jgi:hypothetical protein
MCLKLSEKHQKSKTGRVTEPRTAVKVVGRAFQLVSFGVRVVAVGWGIFSFFNPYGIISPFCLVSESFRTYYVTLLLRFIYGPATAWMILCLGGSILVSGMSAIIIWIGYYQIEDQLR